MNQDTLNARAGQLAVELLEFVLSDPDDPLTYVGQPLHAPGRRAIEMPSPTCGRPDGTVSTCNLNVEIIVRRYVPIAGERNEAL